MKFKYLFTTPLILSIFIINCMNAHFRREVSNDDHQIELEIIPHYTLAYQHKSIVEFDIRMKNLSDRAIAIYDQKYFSYSEDPGCTWYLSVVYEDSISMFDKLVLIQWITPSSSDYEIIKSGGQYSHTLAIEFDRLHYIRQDTAVQPRRLFGDYKVKLIYHDNYNNHRYAIKQPLESNIVDIRYLQTVAE